MSYLTNILERRFVYQQLHKFSKSQKIASFLPEYEMERTLQYQIINEIIYDGLNFSPKDR